jgi:hypothetical protein
MEQDTEVTKVIFRQFKTKERAVIVFFPELPGTNDTLTCMSYMRIGQHSAADASYAIIAKTRPAHPSNYADLKEELESIGYRLQVVYRFTQAAQAKRRAAINYLSQGEPNG